MWNYIATAYIGALFGLFIGSLLMEPLYLMYLVATVILGLQP